MQRREALAIVSGAAITWPFALCAQQKAMPVIGFLHAGSPGVAAPYVAALRDGLSETGHVEGKTWRSNTAMRRDATISCLHWPPTSSVGRST